MSGSGAVFILNPAAGNGRAAGLWDRARDSALQALPGAVFLRTEGPGHAAELAYHAATNGAGRIIAVGGDGTFSEVLEGMMRAPAPIRRNALLGCLPAGSGCDLARHLGYPAELDEVLLVLAGTRYRRLDAGRTRFTGSDGAPRERHFINIAAFGIAGDVARRVATMGKPLGGTLSYLAATLGCLVSARARGFRLRADGRDLSGRYHLVAIANTSSTGGGMKIAPGARDDDGRFDLVTVTDMSRLALLRSFPRIYAGTHLTVPGVRRELVARLEAECDDPAWMNIDGEADGRLPASFELLPGAVSVLTP